MRKKREEERADTYQALCRRVDDEMIRPPVEISELASRAIRLMAFEYRTGFIACDEDTQDWHVEFRGKVGDFDAIAHKTITAKDVEDFGLEGAFMAALGYMVEDFNMDLQAKGLLYPGWLWQKGLAEGGSS